MDHLIIATLFWIYHKDPFNPGKVGQSREAATVALLSSMMMATGILLHFICIKHYVSMQRRLERDFTDKLLREEIV